MLLIHIVNEKLQCLKESNIQLCLTTEQNFSLKIIFHYKVQLNAQIHVQDKGKTLLGQFEDINLLSIVNVF